MGDSCTPFCEQHEKAPGEDSWPPARPKSLAIRPVGLEPFTSTNDPARWHACQASLVEREIARQVRRPDQNTKDYRSCLSRPSGLFGTNDRHRRRGKAATVELGQGARPRREPALVREISVEAVRLFTPNGLNVLADRELSPTSNRVRLSVDLTRPLGSLPVSWHAPPSDTPRVHRARPVQCGHEQVDSTSKGRQRRGRYGEREWPRSRSLRASTPQPSPFLRRRLALRPCAAADAASDTRRTRRVRNPVRDASRSIAS